MSFHKGWDTGNVPRLPILSGVLGRDTLGWLIPVTAPLSPAQRSAPRSGHDYFDVMKLFQRQSSVDNVFIASSWTELGRALSCQGVQHFCVRSWAADGVGVIGFLHSGWEDFPHPLPAPLLSDQPPVPVESKYPTHDCCLHFKWKPREFCHFSGVSD